MEIFFLKGDSEIPFLLLLISTGTLDAIVKMIRFEGLRSFYKGMSTKIVQSVLAASVLFMIKEELVKTFSALLRHRQNTKKLSISAN